MNNTITATARVQRVTAQQARKWMNHSREETRAGYEEHIPNLDPQRMKDNITILDKLNDGKTLTDFVNEVYAQDVQEHNESKTDKRPSRQVTNYAEQRFENSRAMPKPYTEMVFAFGKATDMTIDGQPYFERLPDGSFKNLDVNGEEWTTRKNALKHFGERLPEILPNFSFYYIELHLDELNPHIHAGAIGYTELNNENKKRTDLKHTPGFNQALFKTAQDNGAELKQNQKGEPLASDAFNFLVNELLPGEMMRSYNQVSTVKKERREPRPKRAAITMQEYRELTAPLNELAAIMAEQFRAMNEQLEKMKELTKQLEARDLLEEDEKEKFEEIEKQSKDLEGFEGFAEEIEKLGIAMTTKQTQDEITDQIMADVFGDDALQL